MTYKCPDCKKELQTERGRNSHRSQVHGWEPEKEEAECKNCSSKFTYNPKNCGGVFCSKTCQLSYDEPEQFQNYREQKQKEIEERKNTSICEGCSEQFTYDPGKKKGIFCSQKCFYQNSGEYIENRPGRNTVEKVRKECYICNKTVKRLPGNIYSDVGRVFCSEKCRSEWISQSHIFNSDEVFVEETERKVSSGWEAEIDRILNQSDFEYGYEDSTFELLDGRQYTPDFSVSSVIIEVKGQPSQSSYRRSQQFMELHDEYFYIVVGTEMSCDKHIPWEDRHSLIEVIENVL